MRERKQRKKKMTMTLFKQKHQMSLQLFGEVRLCHMETTGIIRCVAFDLFYARLSYIPFIMSLALPDRISV